MTDEAGQRDDAQQETAPRTGNRPDAGRGPPDDANHGKRCDYCRLPIPGGAISHEHEGDVYEFCSASCREALTESESVFTEYHGFRRTQTGLSRLDAALPEGIPRNSFVLLKETPGARTEAVLAELVWRALQRGEPVVFVSFLEPPVSIVQEFVSLEWNVLPALERGDLQILDCFTYRVDDRSRMYERMNSWNGHIWSTAKEATTTVRDPSDMAGLQSRLDSALEAADMHDEGIVVIDSLTEFGSHVQPVQAYDFLKDVRADVCKGRFVPIFARGSVTGDADEFPHDLGYMFDGIVELRLNEELVEDALIKQLRVRKMSGVLTYPEWAAYEYRPGKGIVHFDPVAEMGAEGPAEGSGGGSAAPAGGQGQGGSGGHGHGEGGGQGQGGHPNQGGGNAQDGSQRQGDGMAQGGSPGPGSGDGGGDGGSGSS